MTSFQEKGSSIEQNCSGEEQQITNDYESSTQECSVFKLLHT